MAATVSSYKRLSQSLTDALSRRRDEMEMWLKKFKGINQDDQSYVNDTCYRGVLLL